MPATVSSGQIFVITVKVRCALPGQSVTMVVEQMRGSMPFWPPQSKTDTVNEEGEACVSFSWALVGHGSAVLVATAYDRYGTYFTPDGAAIEVR